MAIDDPGSVIRDKCMPKPILARGTGAPASNDRSVIVLNWSSRLLHSRTQSPSYARSTDGDEGLWPNPYQTGI